MMFPNARNSFRRWNERASSSSSSPPQPSSNGSKKKQGRIPIPVAVVLHNFILPRPSPPPTPPLDEKERQEQPQLEADPPRQKSATSAAPATTSTNTITSATTASSGGNTRSSASRSNSRSSNSSKWFHPQHDMKLIPRLRLDITVAALFQPRHSSSVGGVAVAASKTAKTDESQDDDDGNNNNNADDDEGSTAGAAESDLVDAEIVVVYSETAANRAVHPSWEHLDERIRIPIDINSTDGNATSSSQPPPLSSSYSEIQNAWWNHNDLYKSMRLKLSIVVPEESCEDEDDNDNTIVLSNTEEQQQEQERKERRQHKTVELMDVPLHPSLLQRIDVAFSNSTPGTGDNNDSYDDDDDDDHDDTDGKDFLNPFSIMLPPNALLVHFSDGSIRCPTYLYQILVDAQQIDSFVGAAPLVEDFSRFEDDVFKALDGAQQTPQRPRERTASSLLDHDDDSAVVAAIFQVESPALSPMLSSSLPLSPPSRRKHHTTPIVSPFSSSPSTLQHQKHHPDNDGSTGLRGPPLPLLQGATAANGNNAGGSTTPTPPTPASAVTTVRESLCNPTSATTTTVHRSLPKDNSSILQQDWVSEKEDLLRLIAQEEESLQEDHDALQEQAHLLEMCTLELQSVQRDVLLVRREVHLQSLELQKDEFIKDAQCIKLVRELRPIYPIALRNSATSGGGTGSGAGVEGYVIRGLRLPVDIYTTQVPDEEVNASLGYCAHLTFMIAKYLAVQLRHRIFCNSSRSAIQQDGLGVFPLFLGRLAARALEREQVDRGLRLLGQNVNCVLMHLQLSPSLHQVHILGRLKTILDHVAEGSSSASTNIINRKIQNGSNGSTAGVPVTNALEAS